MRDVQGFVNVRMAQCVTQQMDHVYVRKDIRVLCAIKVCYCYAYYSDNVNNIQKNLLQDASNTSKLNF